LEELRRDLLGKPVFDISVLTLAWQAVEHAAHASNKLKFKKSLRKLQKAILSVISD
jgi:hypothetical protein